LKPPASADGELLLRYSNRYTFIFAERLRENKGILMFWRKFVGAAACPRPMSEAKMRFISN
jgi:hypothetical protein